MTPPSPSTTTKKPDEDQVHLVYDRQNAEADGIYVLEMDSLFSSS